MADKYCANGKGCTKVDQHAVLNGLNHQDSTVK